MSQEILGVRGGRMYCEGCKHEEIPVAIGHGPAD
jgi:hypothetical protein